MKKLILLISCLLLFAAIVGCNGDGKTEDRTDDTSSDAQSTDAPNAQNTVTIDSSYKFVRKDEDDADLVSYIMTWRNEFIGAIKQDIGIVTDWDKNNRANNTVESSSDVHEILIGNTNRRETKDIAESKQVSCGYVISYVNGKLVLWGTDVNTTIMALDALYDMVDKENGTLSVPDDLKVVWSLTGEGGVLNTLMLKYQLIEPAKADDRTKATAENLKKELGEMTGMALKIAKDGNNESGEDCEILLGETSRSESKKINDTLTYNDYVIKVENKKVILTGGSPLSVERAANMFVTLLKTAQIKSLDEEFEYRWIFKEKRPDSIIYNIDSFKPVWADSLSIPDWLKDFNEKKYAIVTPGGRMTSDAHRGDHQDYPENSAEGILSAVMLGVDCVEIDPRLTKDGVIVLLHDESLKRTTDWASKKGKNGLPTSEKVGDWTYEQLLQLNLRDHMGKDANKVTEYKICTAYEAVSIMAGKTMIHWDCKDSDGILCNVDTFALAAELNAKANFYYYYNDATMNSWYKLDTSDTEFKAFLNDMADYIKQVGGSRRKRRFENIDELGDDPTAWLQGRDKGYEMVFTNHTRDLCAYIAENSKPITEK